MTNFAGYPWRHGDATPEQVAFRCGESIWTYGQLQEAMARLAGAVRARGVGPGDRVLLVGPTVPEFAVAFYALQAAGVAVVAMNPMATASELDYILGDADCSLAVVWEECLGPAAEAAAARSVELWPLTAGVQGLPIAPPLTAPHDCHDDDTAVILYTSGTTGRPKGAELTHANLISCAQTFTDVLEVSSEDTFGTALPLSHVFGSMSMMGTAMMNGASMFLLPRFRPVEALEMISGGRVSIFAGVPTMYNALLQHATEWSDFSRLRFCCSGGASLPTDVLRAFKERFGVVILEGYALTETTAAATFNGLHRQRKPGFVGVPLPGMQVRVVDPAGAELGPDLVGEVIIRGPQVMKGYYGRPEATAETLRDGWLYTGDLGLKDVDGDLRIVDRKKDLIIRGGYNVYPQEVEQVLYEHPDVVEVAVVGVKDAHLGEEVAAVVVLKSGAQTDPHALNAWAKTRLSAYKVPRLFRFSPALPQGATGKILKRGMDEGSFLDVRTGSPL
jgi:long-chain acyl-CoA synthetase